MKVHRNEEAIKAYERAIEIDPDYADAWSNKGFTLLQLGKYKEAKEAFMKAVSINKIKNNYHNA